MGAQRLARCGRCRERRSESLPRPSAFQGSFSLCSYSSLQQARQPSTTRQPMDQIRAPQVVRDEADEDVRRGGWRLDCAVGDGHHAFPPGAPSSCAEDVLLALACMEAGKQ